MDTVKQFIAICLFLLVAVLLFNLYSAYKISGKPSQEKSSEPKSCGLLGVLDPKEALNLTRLGREKAVKKLALHSLRF